VVLTGPPRQYYLGLIVICVNCSMATEVDPETGNLVEVPRWRLVNLLEPYNAEDVPRTMHTLVCSGLYNGRES